MKTLLTQGIIAYIIFATLVVPTQPVFAVETYEFNTVLKTATFRFNNENWFTTEHPRVMSFSINDDGSSNGLLETGVSFVQYNVPNDLGIRVQRFEIEDHYHYIIEGEIAYTFENFSAQLAEAYRAKTTSSAT